jgi:hypothetical protein
MTFRKPRTATAFTALTLSLLPIPTLLLASTLARGADTKPSGPELQAAYDGEIKPLLDKYCANCHGAKKPAGGIDLTKVKEVAALQKDQTAWRKVVTQVHDRSMPPNGMPQPTQAEREKLVNWLTHTLDNVDESLLPKNPGRVLIHRLSRSEYNNTVRDIFGVTSKPADKFPIDGGGGGGFDNNADTLFVPPVLMERYLEAATQILNETASSRLFFVRPSKTVNARTAAQQIVQRYATLGFRRPAEPAEVTRLMSLYDRATQRGEKFEGAVRFALKGVLVSPNFLFRVEQDRPTATDAYPLNDYELASRLSYFLWSSTPDAELYQLAKQNRLRDPKVLDTQIKRMLRSPKSAAFADSFASQWLRVRDLYTVAQPDPKRYTNYTPTLRDAMYQETIQFFQSVLQDDASLLKLLDADYTYLNEELAKHYGIAGVNGSEMRRVALTDAKRGGVLTQASILTITSYPRRTSPVLRGKWVLEEILGTPPPPPPPGAGGLPAEDAPKEGLTFRQRLEKHREKPQCASCHNRMDPIGFGLENFDVVGQWRTMIGDQAVDSTGILANGEKFSGPVELKQQILARKDQYARNLSERMLTYALGRGLEPYDLPAVRKITEAVEKDNYRSTTLIKQVVMSYPFQYKKNL